MQNNYYLTTQVICLTFLFSILLLPCGHAQNGKQRLPETEQKVPGLDLNTNRINTIHQLYPELDGEGITVSIKENQYDTADIDIIMRHLPSRLGSGFTVTHASLMATIVGGAGNTGYAGRGVAKGAQLTTADFLNLWPDGKNYYESLDIGVQNHSYGVGIENFYGADAVAYDASVWELPYLMHIFSAGNQGDIVSEEGSYDGIEGYANLTGSFKMAKNILTVAAVENTLIINSQVSKGPAYDGRLKPDLMAAGQDGSSGAAALVSGTSVLLQQIYQKQTNELPPAALVRATLLNSTEDIGPPGIDYQSGFGNLNALQAVESLQQQQHYLGSVSNGGLDSFNITVPQQAAELKITLSWTDPPADSLIEKALINDLDLELYHPETGQTWQPWILSTFPHADSLSQPPRRGRDTLNNNEQVSITMPPAGEYRLRVKGSDVPEGPQSFAIAYDWDTLNHFMWTNPVSGNHFEGGETTNLRWMTTIQNTPTKLEFTTDEGKNWQSLAESIDLEEESWLWEVPDIFTLAQLRLSTAIDTFYSSTFYIYRSLQPRVGYNCETSVFLYWNRLEKADNYIVYALDERYLQPVAIVQDTFLEVNKAINSSLHYAVSPQLSDTPENLRSSTINYNLQGIGCYFKNLFARVFEETQAILQLELGTLFGVQRITIEKWVNGQYVSIGTVLPGETFKYSFFDTALREGENIYRPKIELQNGSVQYGDEVALFYVPKETYLVFPNPVRGGEELEVISGTSDESERIFYLFNGLGRQVNVLPLDTASEFLELDHLPEGAYFYQIRKDGKQQQTGRVIVVRE